MSLVGVMRWKLRLDLARGICMKSITDLPQIDLLTVMGAGGELQGVMWVKLIKK